MISALIFNNLELPHFRLQNMKIKPLIQLREMVAAALSSMSNLSKSFRTFIIETMELYLTTSGRMNGSLSHFLGTQIPVPVFFLFSLPRHRPFAYPVCVAARKPRFWSGNLPRHVRIGTSVCVATGGAGNIHCQKDVHQQDSHHCSGNCRHLWNPTFFLSRRGTERLCQTVDKQRLE